MNQLTIKKPRNNHDSHCARVMAKAERELAAFFRAVTELFGPEQAKLSVEEWLEELAAANGLPSSAREWRRITLNIYRRLAARSSALSLFDCIANTGITIFKKLLVAGDSFSQKQHQGKKNMLGGSNRPVCLDGELRWFSRLCTRGH